MESIHTEKKDLSEIRRQAGLKGLAVQRANRHFLDERDRKIRLDYERRLKKFGGRKYGVVKIVIEELCDAHNLGRKSIEKIIYSQGQL